MATSRGGTPANPTLVATTEDSARGGLFARSNTGFTAGQSPASSSTDIHITGVSFNDTSRVLTVTRSDNTSFTATIPGGGGSSGPATDTNFYIADVRLNGTTLIFDYNSGSGLSPTSVDLSSIAGGITQTELDMAIATAVANISFTGLTDTPNSLGSAGQQLRVDSLGDALEFFTPAPSGITASEFGSLNGTVVIANAAQGSPHAVDLQSRIRIFGNDANPGNTTNSIAMGTQENFTAFTVSPLLEGPNGRPLTFVNAGAGIVELVESGAGTPTPGVPSETDRAPTPTSFFDAPMDETVTIMLMNGMVPTDPNRQPTATVTDPNGDTITPTININPGRTEVDVVIPAADGGPIGNYDVTTTVPVNDMDGNAAPDLTVMDTYVRFAPYVEVRGTEPTTAAEIEAGVESTEEWTGSLTVQTPAANGTLYLVVPVSDLPSTTAFFTVTTLNGMSVGRMAHRGMVPVTSAGVTIQYNVFQVGGSPDTGALLNNFRDTR